MFKSNKWFGWNSKPKNPHSLEQLKYLYNVMSENQTVSDQNRTLLVETLRSVAEILIWSDQNDSNIFEFFLEGNILSFILKIMKQKCGSYVCVQLLQTLNILFENIRNETSLHYLLSNNHVNSIIVHKFDFSDGEVMAYYISFLKTLSLKLNPQTIPFFFDEHTNDFPLYTEAIKFFNHSEKMVRIAVRTITLNVFRVDGKSMLKFIRDCTAAPYFSNLVWFIGNNVINIDNCLFNSKMDGHQVLIRLDDLVAEHLDHLHYLNDILLLDISDLNNVLSDHLLNRLLIPLYIFSLIYASPTNPSTRKRPHISQTVSLFLFTQVFLIVSNKILLLKLVDILLNSDKTIFEYPEFVPPNETLEESLIQAAKAQNSDENDSETNEYSMNSIEDKSATDQNIVNRTAEQLSTTCPIPDECDISPTSVRMSLESSSLTDEEKANSCVNRSIAKQILTENKPFLEAVLRAMDFDNQPDDRLPLFSICLLYSIINNSGMNEDKFKEVVLQGISAKSNSSQSLESDTLHNELIDILIEIMRKCCQYNSRIRLITLEMSILLLKRLVIRNGSSILSDHHLAVLEQAKEESILILRNFFKSEEELFFLDMFEDELNQINKRQLNVEYLIMDSNLLLPPNQLKPLMMTGIEFNRRLPCADVERTRYAIQVFFLLRNLSLLLRNEKETQLPLTNFESCIKVGESGVERLNDSLSEKIELINDDEGTDDEAGEGEGEEDHEEEEEEETEETEEDFQNKPQVKDKSENLIEELTKKIENEPKDINDLCSKFVNISINGFDSKTAELKDEALIESEIYLKFALESNKNEFLSINSLLVNLGLLKDESGRYKTVDDLRGPLSALTHSIKLLTPQQKHVLRAFMNRPHKQVEQCGKIKHSLMSKLFI